MTKNEIFNLVKNYQFLHITQKDFDHRFRMPLYRFKIDERYMFTEIGEDISPEIINFYLNNLKKANIPKYEYSAYKCYSIKHYSNKLFFVNAIGYTRRCVPVIKDCIYKLDMLKAVIMGIVSAENRVKELKKYKTVSREEIDGIMDYSIKKKLKDRKRMWQEIEEGINRFLSGDNIHKGVGSTIFRDEDLLSQNIHKGISSLPESFLMLHGDQLRRWIRNNIYWELSEKPKLIMLGHFHIMFPMIKNTTLIMFQGHFVDQYQTKFSKYYFSHLGGSTFEANFEEIRNVTFLRLVKASLKNQKISKNHQ